MTRVHVGCVLYVCCLRESVNMCVVFVVVLYVCCLCGCLIEGVSEHGEALEPPPWYEATGEGEDWQQWSAQVKEEQGTPGISYSGIKV